MTWVKVCGVRTTADIEAALDAGADAVGFVVYEKSVRHIDAEAVRALAADVPVTTVLVTAHLDADSLLHVAEVAGVDAVQPHGEHSAVAARAAIEAGLSVLRPVKADGPVDLSSIPGEQLPLIDSEVIGGSGSGFDWSWLEGLTRRFVLAGGLGPDNVEAAIQQVKPWGVDASSRLESSPGIKDPGLIAEFVGKAKHA